MKCWYCTKDMKLVHTCEREDGSGQGCFYQCDCGATCSVNFLREKRLADENSDFNE